MKVIDCFTFNNELDMLEYRLATLYKSVDYFILVEASHTHPGKAKSFVFEENKSRYTQFIDKIIHIKVNDMPNETDPWVNENWQRNCIDRGIQKLDMKEDDIIIIADLDEIPDPSVLLKLKETGVPTTAALGLELYNYTLNYKSPDDWNDKTKITCYKEYCEVFSRKPQDIRMSYKRYLVENAGWHFSWMCPTVETLIKKLSCTAHQEDNTDKNNNREYLEKCVKEGKIFWSDRKLEYIPLSKNKHLPPNLDLFLQFYPANY
jgi:beta-1,4-mannosyl-glycoprotein beta-1,4-N-acetylglucosaminyltransferase